MKIHRFYLPIYLTALSFYFLTGCLPIQLLNKTSVSQNSSQTDISQNSSQTGISQNSSQTGISQNSDENISKCPNQPTTVLKTNNVKTVSLSSQTIIESGMVTNNKSLGYTFTGKKGNNLVYQTDENICIWVYTPDNKLINNPSLPVDGKYTIQIAAMESATTSATAFDLALQLEDNTQAVNLSSSRTPVKTNQIRKTQTPETQTPETQIRKTQIRKTQIRKTQTPETQTSETQTPETQTPETQTPETQTPETQTPETQTPETNYISKISNRISPAKVIENYYTMINNKQYDSAWDIYPTAVKEDKELHPNGYDSFIEWWTKVNYVKVTNVSIESENNDSAIVKFRSRYKMKNGKSIPVRLKFYLVWNQENENWYVTKIKLI